MCRVLWSMVALWMALAFVGCQRRSYTEADVQRAIAEQQREAQTEIERGVRAAPPIVMEKPPQDGSGAPGSAPPDTGTVDLPPPNRYDAPPPASPNTPTQSAPPPSVGDVRLEPRTGEYGIQPPGAPETYTIPLNQQPQGQ